jgi:GNAT superfamily N-acetyltransferase
MSGGILVDFLNKPQIPEAVDILTEAFGRRYRRDFETRLKACGTGHLHAITATRDAQVIGVAMMSENLSSFQGLPAIRVQDLAVAKSARKSGVGTKVLDYVAHVAAIECLSGGMGFMVLYDDTKLRGFYRNRGYVNVNPNIKQQMCKPLNGAVLPDRKRAVIECNKL